MNAYVHWDTTSVAPPNRDANPAAVSVLAEGNTVTLRGTIKDLDEAKVLVSMARMTPGVFAVKNELKIQKP